MTAPARPKTQGINLRGRGIGVTRGGTEILRGVDIWAAPGQLVGVLGPSGSGKSTLLYALTGFRPATTGVVTMNGNDVVKDFDSLKRRIGFVPQDDIVPTALRVERVLRYTVELRLPPMSKTLTAQRVERVMAKLGLMERRSLRVSSLSGGQRKRVSIAVEMLGEPDILFADEPTSGLDPALEASLTQLLRAMADEGRTIVVTTHILSSIDIYDRIAVVAAGMLVFFGPPAELKPFFEVDDLTQIYSQFGGDRAASWKKKFQASRLHQQYLGR